MNEQVFHFGPQSWDVERAIAIIADHPREPTRIKVEEIVRIAGFIDIDMEYADQLPLSRLSDPLIAVPFDVGPKEGPKAHIVIDGWHRAVKASNIGRTWILCWFLTETEAKECELERRR